MISRDGNPTHLGQAIAHYGRIFKTLHILRLADDEPYRREAKAQANLQEGRHDLGRTVFHAARANSPAPTSTVWKIRWKISWTRSAWF